MQVIKGLEAVVIPVILLKRKPCVHAGEELTRRRLYCDSQNSVSPVNASTPYRIEVSVHHGFVTGHTAQCDSLIVPIHRPTDSGRDNCISHAPKEAGRQIAIAYRGLATYDWSNIVARPRKAIPLGDNDPRPVTGQAQVTPHSLRHFDCLLIAGRGLGGQRHDMHLIDPVLGLCDQNNRDRTVLYTFIAAFSVLVFPQVAVVEDFTRLRQR